MKKLHRLITVQFFKTFIPTFLVVLFIMLMQFIWLYIDDLAGKGLSMWVILQLLFYVMVGIIPMALPLSVLLASIMTFGNLGETYELIAAKAAGVSIWRIFMPMYYIMILLCGFAFMVSNTFIPIAMLKQKSLLYDIKQQKPALMIQEGVFYSGIDGINMRIGKKDVNTGDMFDIVIYDNRNSVQRPVVVTAKRGTMHMSDDERYLFFTLYEGERYEEHDRQSGYERTKAHNRLRFAEEQIVFDLFSFTLNRTDESHFKDGYQMLNIYKLADKLDTLMLTMKEKVTANDMYYNMYLRLNDSLFGKYPARAATGNMQNILDSFPGSKSAVIFTALNNARTVKSMQDYIVAELELNNKMFLRYKIEWHKKFTLSVACIIMFFIGAPFGVIIRKGGFGMPLVISVVLYIIFHIVTIVGDKMVKSGSTEPVVGVWLPIMVLFPIGVFLTYQAANDSGLFDVSAWKKIFRLKAHKTVHT